MGLHPSVLRAMADAGASTEVILAAIEAQASIDEDRLEAQRAGNAERQQRFRDRRSARKKGNGKASNESNALRTVTPPIDNIHTPPVSSDEETISPKRVGNGSAKPDDVSEPVWRDFLTHRKAQKAPVSETVIAGIRREAEKAGWTLEAALTELVARGWRGFKASWVAEQPAPPGKANGSNGGRSEYLTHLLAKQTRHETATQ